MTRSNRKNRRFGLRVRVLLGTLAGLALGIQGATLLTPANAATDDKASEQDTAKQAEPPQGSDGRNEVSRFVAGVKVSIDPDTGRLRQPTPEEAAQLAVGLEAMLSHSPDGLRVVRQPNGTLSVNLEDRFHEAALARVNPDGSVALGCVSDPKGAEAFLKGAIVTDEVKSDPAPPPSSAGPVSTAAEKE